ncbi:MAG: hypothetical protein WC378_21010 [Opitutaceae bacterium]|jgi:DNA polymerase/3'-5' exonuclease PolX
MELTKAKLRAEEIKTKLTPFCKTGKCEVAGSVRRGNKPDVHDIDLVCIPISQAFYLAMNQLGKVSGGPKNYRVELPIISQGKAFTADIYIATEATWATLLLIRTGSANHNKRLCTLARSKGMKLHADGSGLSRLMVMSRLMTEESALFVAPDGERPIPCTTETDIFAALGLPYRAPAERE